MRIYPNKCGFKKLYFLKHLLDQNGGQISFHLTTRTFKFAGGGGGVTKILKKKKFFPLEF